MSPALADGFLTTAPPGKPVMHVFNSLKTHSKEVSPFRSGVGIAVFFLSCGYKAAVQKNVILVTFNTRIA